MQAGENLCALQEHVLSRWDEFLYLKFRGTCGPFAQIARGST